MKMRKDAYWKTLHDIELYGMEQLGENLYFAYDRLGMGRICNETHFLGYTGNWSTPKKGKTFRVSVWNIDRSKGFTRCTYLTIAGARRALRREAIELNS